MEKETIMSRDERTDQYEDLDDDVSEEGEAEGVAEIEMKMAPLSAADAEALDRETLDGLDDQERGALEEATRAARPGAKAAGSPALSKNFVLAEFHCCRGHCAGAAVPSAAIPALRRLVTHVLQPMRDRFGSCSVHSGFRNDGHNRHVRGEDNSHHLYHRRPASPAADVSFASGDVEAWATEARRLSQRVGNVGGIGRYPAQGFVHVDLGAKRSWPTPGL
jgi:hypothetical protein